jgi:CRP-like cAMP-binding protein
VKSGADSDKPTLSYATITPNPTYGAMLKKVPLLSMLPSPYSVSPSLYLSLSLSSSLLISLARSYSFSTHPIAKFTDEERAVLGGVLEERVCILLFLFCFVCVPTHSTPPFILQPLLTSPLSPFSSSLSPSLSLSLSLPSQKHVANEPIVCEGDIGHGFYIIVEGTATVTRKGVSGPIGKLVEGDYFGEAALINESKRGATVSADCGMRTFYLDREAFSVLFTEERLHVQFAKRNAISAEVVASDPNKRYSTVAPINARTDKDEKTMNTISAAVKDNLLFQGLDHEHRMQIISEMWLVEVKAGSNVIDQGDKGDNFYVVHTGSFDIFVASGDKSRKVATRGLGTCFGELALMYNAPRAATVTATEPSSVWAVDRFTFRRILANVSDAQIQEFEAFLKQVELLAPLSGRERSKVAEALEEESFKAGAEIIKQGDIGDCMYILRSGETVCSIDGKEVARYKDGDYFGERSLIKDEPRAATIKCHTACTVLKLDRTAFSLLLGPLEDIMTNRVKRYNTETKLELDAEEAERKAAVAALSGAPPRGELQVIGTLGKGSFGHVQLVQYPPTGQIFALKAVSKQQIVQTGQQGHIMSEKRVMAMLDHPFLIKLHGTYKDPDRLFFLLEVCLGGELFSVLRARTFFDEDTARFYAASVVLAFEFMHSKNIIYRDLKPENLLLDKDGYLKVTDFGFAKIVTGRTYTLCGTPDYLAPEIVAGKGHGKGVDWWTLGILIYEMLSSYPPFYDEDPMKTYAKIMHGKIAFPSHFSKEAISLISKLLHHKPTKRLGVVKGGASLIKEHPWFAGFDWDALLARQMKAPILPKISSTTDLSNFDDYPDTDDFPQYIDNGTDWDADF